ncbi:monocyte to macrophage differentiation factor [Thamnophis elegans]|nr:monocyte to macrophage differentiation factor [Thamnophis elegans]
MSRSRNPRLASFPLDAEGKVSRARHRERGGGEAARKRLPGGSLPRAPPPRPAAPRALQPIVPPPALPFFPLSFFSPTPLGSGRGFSPGCVRLTLRGRAGAARKRETGAGLPGGTESSEAASLLLLEAALGPAVRRLGCLGAGWQANEGPDSGPRCLRSCREPPVPTSGPNKGGSIAPPMRRLQEKFRRFMNHPAPANSRYKPTCYEHAANCYTHAFLIFPAIVGSALLHRLSEDQWEKITAWIYGVGLCALFIISTVFHIISWKKSHLRTMEHCFHMCDRMMIYIFIAASYAPWLNLRELGPLASHMRWFIWLMAAGGAFYVFLYHEKYKIVELFFYLAMGFSPALVVTSMNNTDGLQELAWGGVIYCMGVIFFKSDGIIPFAHAIWHLFVATAAAVHYYAIWKYLYKSPADIILQL